MRVLIVDDDFNNRLLLQTLLRAHGECVLASNGAEAVDLFTQAMQGDAPFDLVLMDIMMPVMDGQEALKQIRLAEKRFKGHTLQQESRPYTIVYMVTGLDDPVQMVRSYSQGKCNGYITKPVHADDLYNRLMKHDLISPDAYDPA